jgi:hypothetical protein
MVVLQHDFQVQFGGQPPRRTSARLIDYGVPSAIPACPRTVGLPAAVAANGLWLQRIRLTGVRIPGRDPGIISSDFSANCTAWH